MKNVIFVDVSCNCQYAWKIEIYRTW